MALDLNENNESLIEKLTDIGQTYKGYEVLYNEATRESYDYSCLRRERVIE